ncbi:exported hypothetical protein [Candidatus Terasakiella magnetica]|uniref:Lipoprotein n=1 Tax=Candidatus Terasakiella magnetica TaxID=1867952 RepID=A0A1C3RET4_9PROT|nr:hypothetical protein [Candidatus Terasakiella magnetica]SCA55779.1 exported hypothetical protein [Candidatus Terasakiella magnetica]
MKVFHSAALLCCSVVLSGCFSHSMMRTQQHFGVEGWIAGAATEGHLDVVVYGTDDHMLKKSIVQAMDGHHEGPPVPMRLLDKDPQKGTRIVVILDHGHDVYSSYACDLPKEGIDFDKGPATRAALTFCYDDTEYGFVSATSLQGKLMAGSAPFDDFYRNATYYLANPYYEETYNSSDCELGSAC